VNAVDIVLSPVAPSGRIEFRIGDEGRLACRRCGAAGLGGDPDVVVEGDAEALYHMFVDRRLDLMSVEATARCSNGCSPRRRSLSASSDGLDLDESPLRARRRPSSARDTAR
jgi:hypothetical protein